MLVGVRSVTIRDGLVRRHPSTVGCGDVESVSDGLPAGQALRLATMNHHAAAEPESPGTEGGIPGGPAVLLDEVSDQQMGAPA